MNRHCYFGRASIPPIAYNKFVHDEILRPVGLQHFPNKCSDTPRLYPVEYVLLSNSYKDHDRILRERRVHAALRRRAAR